MDICCAGFRWCEDRRGEAWPKRIELLVDGVTFAEYLESQAFLPSAVSDWQSVFESRNTLVALGKETSYKGKYPAFLECACGDPDCDSIWVNLHCDGHYITIRGLQSYRDITTRRYEMDKFEPLIFELTQWMEAIRSIYDE